jgi:hypothetical protein
MMDEEAIKILQEELDKGAIESNQSDYKYKKLLSNAIMKMNLGRIA